MNDTTLLILAGLAIAGYAYSQKNRKGSPNDPGDPGPGFPDPGPVTPGDPNYYNPVIPREIEDPHRPYGYQYGDRIQGGFLFRKPAYMCQTQHNITL